MTPNLIEKKIFLAGIAIMWLQSGLHAQVLTPAYEPSIKEFSDMNQMIVKC